jgi:hypothetical protein
MPAFAQAQQQIVDAARRLADRGFLVATGGNLSVRIPGRAAFAVTPSNLDYHRAHRRLYDDRFAAFVDVHRRMRPVYRRLNPAARPKETA